MLQGLSDIGRRLVFVYCQTDKCAHGIGGSMRRSAEASTRTERCPQTVSKAQKQGKMQPQGMLLTCHSNGPNTSLGGWWLRGWRLPCSLVATPRHMQLCFHSPARLRHQPPWK